MDVLISWSKNQSREIAAAFYDWLPKVVRKSSLGCPTLTLTRASPGSVRCRTP